MYLKFAEGVAKSGEKAVGTYGDRRLDVAVDDDRSLPNLGLRRKNRVDESRTATPLEGEAETGWTNPKVYYFPF